MQPDINSELLKSILYDKSFTCPLCGDMFTSKAIKLRKNQVISIDIDLYPHYSLVDPLLYDIIVCPKCGYSVLAKNFSPLLPKQKEWLRTIFNKGETTTHYGEYTTFEEAIQKHKMALLASITKKGKLSEQAYIALHISWLYRHQENPVEAESFLKRAYDGFAEAFSIESFPMLGIDEQTLLYMLAAMAYELNDLTNSKLYLSKLITSIGLSARLQSHAHQLKDLIHEAEQKNRQ